MTKTEFLTRLQAALESRNVADPADILEEYEQHFAFKLADGYVEEEIAAKLGSPEDLAAQFESEPQSAARRRAPSPGCGWCEPTCFSVCSRFCWQPSAWCWQPAC